MNSQFFRAVDNRQGLKLDPRTKCLLFLAVVIGVFMDGSGAFSQCAYYITFSVIIQRFIANNAQNFIFHRFVSGIIEHHFHLVGGAADTAGHIRKVSVFVFYHRQFTSVLKNS